MAYTRRQTTSTAPLSTLKFFLGLVSLTIVVRPVHGQSIFESLFALLGRPCNSNIDAERCGGFGYVMRIGSDGTQDCQEKCAYLPFFNFGYTCGSCAPLPPQAPSSPVPAPSGTPAAPVSPLFPVLFPPIPVASPIQATESSYEIALDLVGSTSILSASEREAFTDVTDRWEAIVSTGVSDISASDLPAGPRFTGCRYPTIIDDLYICVRVARDDGVGGTLGYASPSYQRSSDGLTISGYINLDVDDVQDLINEGTFAAVFAHEVGHILGIGTYFVENDVAGPDNQRCPYYGSKASLEFAKISSCDVVPLETRGRSGDGTYCAHWAEGCLEHELMTGTINYGGENPLSRITIGSLEDLGYPGVDYSLADTYTAADLGSCSCRRRSLIESSPLLRSLVSSLKNDKPPRRKLSEETRQYGYEQGLKFLRENPANPASAVGSLFNRTTGTQGSLDSDVARYVGDRGVSVLVQDGPGGDIYGIHVENPAYNP